MNRLLYSLIILTFVVQTARGQEPQANYDESKVGTFTLPDPLVMSDGQRVTTRDGWEKRRAELLALFAEHVYGKTPSQPVRLRFQTTQTDNNALNGRAIRKQVSIFFADYPKLAPIEVVLYVPKAARKPVPVFLGLNFCGNHCVSMEADLPLSTRWMNNAGDASVNNRATEKARGQQARRWPIDTILAHGYALATAYYGDIEPDHPKGWQTGIRSVLGDPTRQLGSHWGLGLGNEPNP